MNVRTILKTQKDDGWTERSQAAGRQREWGERKSTVWQNYFNTWNKQKTKQTRSKVNDERARHRCPFAPPLTFTHALGGKKKSLGGSVRVKREGRWGYRWRYAGKHLHGIETMSRFQVASGQFFGVGGQAGGGGGVPQMSSPRNLSSNDFLFLWPTVRLWQIAAHLPRCVPGSQNIVKAVFLSCRSLQAPDSTPHQGSLITRSTLFWRENGGHPNWRRIMGGWNEDDSV